MCGGDILDQENFLWQWNYFLSTLFRMVVTSYMQLLNNWYVDSAVDLMKFSF